MKFSVIFSVTLVVTAICVLRTMNIASLPPLLWKRSWFINQAEVGGYAASISIFDESAGITRGMKFVTLRFLKTLPLARSAFSLVFRVSMLEHYIFKRSETISAGELARAHSLWAYGWQHGCFVFVTGRKILTAPQPAHLSVHGILR